MPVNGEKLRAASVGFQTIFNKAFAAAAILWTLLAMRVQSKNSSESYKWLGDMPQLREWIGERQVRELTAYDYTLKNKTFEGTIGVDVEDYEDDNLGVWAPQFAALGGQAARHPDKLVFGLLNDGFTAKGYDGKAFFATDHANSFNNKGTGALSDTSYDTARVALQAQKNAAGDPVGLVLSDQNTTLVVPPALEKTGKLLVESPLLDGGQANPFYKSARLVVGAHLTSATAWFLLVDHDGLKPLIYQERRLPRLTLRADPRDDNVFWDKRVIHGVDYRGNAGYGLHQLAYGSTGAG